MFLFSNRFSHFDQVAPYNTFYSELEQHMAEVGVEATVNKWDEPLALGVLDPHDSISHPAGVSDVQTESATHMDSDQFTEFLVCIFLLVSGESYAVVSKQIIAMFFLFVKILTAFNFYEILGIFVFFIRRIFYHGLACHCPLDVLPTLLWNLCCIQMIVFSSLMHRFQTGLKVNHPGLQKSTRFHYQMPIWPLSREMYVHLLFQIAT